MNYEVGGYQFVNFNNLSKISRAILQVSKENMGLLVFDECALCGYSLIESKIEEICQYDIEMALNKISMLAKQKKMFIAVASSGEVCYEKRKGIFYE